MGQYDEAEGEDGLSCILLVPLAGDKTSREQVLKAVRKMNILNLCVIGFAYVYMSKSGSQQRSGGLSTRTQSLAHRTDASFGATFKTL